MTDAQNTELTDPPALGVTLAGFGTFAGGVLTACFASASTPEAAVVGLAVAVFGGGVAIVGMAATEMNYRAQRNEARNKIQERLDI